MFNAFGSSKPARKVSDVLSDLTTELNTIAEREAAEAVLLKVELEATQVKLKAAEVEAERATTAIRNITNMFGG